MDFIKSSFTCCYWLKRNNADNTAPSHAGARTSYETGVDTCTLSISFIFL